MRELDMMWIVSVTMLVDSDQAYILLHLRVLKSSYIDLAEHLKRGWCLLSTILFLPLF